VREPLLLACQVACEATTSFLPVRLARPLRGHGTPRPRHRFIEPPADWAFQNFVVVIASIMALPAARANADRSCVAGPKHQLILSEPHGLFLAIDGRVLD